MKRVAIAELLDSDAGSPSEIASSLHDLDRINRWFGGISSSCALLEHVSRAIGQRQMAVLEVAAGSGTTTHAVQTRIQRRGITTKFTLLDRAPSHLKNGHMSVSNAENAVAGDAIKLPFAENSFDVVSSNLFVHHLNPDELMEFVQQALLVCREAVIITDLSRSWFHLGLVYAGLPLFRSRLTWHDAPASVRQAYTAEEIAEILSRCGAASVEMEKHYLFRIGAIIWKRNPDNGQPHV